MNLFLFRAWLSGLYPFLILPTCYHFDVHLLTMNQKLCIILYIMYWLPICLKLHEHFYICFLFLKPRCVSSFCIWLCFDRNITDQFLTLSLMLVILRILGIYVRASCSEWQSWNWLELEKALEPYAEVCLPSLPILQTQSEYITQVFEHQWMTSTAYYKIKFPAAFTSLHNMAITFLPSQIYTEPPSPRPASVLLDRSQWQYTPIAHLLCSHCCFCLNGKDTLCENVSDF